MLLRALSLNLQPTFVKTHPRQQTYKLMYQQKICEEGAEIEQADFTESLCNATNNSSLSYKSCELIKYSNKAHQTLKDHHLL